MPMDSRIANVSPGWRDVHPANVSEELLIGRRSRLDSPCEGAPASGFGRPSGAVSVRLSAGLSVDFRERWQFEKFDGVGKGSFFIWVVRLRDGVRQFRNRIAAAKLNCGLEGSFANLGIAIGDFRENGVEIGAIVGHGHVHKL